MASTANDDLSSAEAAAKTAASAFDHLKKVGRYELIRKLGQGGMGAVFLALDTNLRRNVALKILPQEKAQNPTLVRRFQSEAQNAAQLKHENIVEVYEAGEADGYLYIALEFVDGMDVHDLVERRGILPVKRSIDIVKQVGRALQHAFERSIVHRDIKPANLLIRRDGVVKLTDMGLARAVDESTETGITRAGCTVGTVDYMAPEQARDSKSADSRSDIYSLGCTWYHMLTGAPPFPEGSLTNKLRAHAQQRLPDPRDKNPRVPEGVVAILNQMLAKDPKDRYQTPQELLDDLDQALISRDAVSRTIFEDDEPEQPAKPGKNSPETQTGGQTTTSSRSYRRSPQQPADDESEDELPASTLPPRNRRPTPPPEDGPEPTSSRSRRVTPPPEDAGEAIPARSRRKPSPADSDGDADVPVSRSRRSAPQPAPDDEPDSYTPTRVRRGSPDAQDDDDLPISRRGGRARAPIPETDEAPSPVASSAPPAKGPDKRKLPPKVNEKGGAGEIEVESAASDWQKKVKPFLVIGGIILSVGVILYLVRLAERYGNSVTIQAGQNQGNPFENAPPPPGMATKPGTGTPNDPAEAAVENTVKDVLIERNQELAGDSNANGTASANDAANQLVISGANKTTAGIANPLPTWVDQPVDLSKTQIFSVRTGGKESKADRQYASLASALKDVPAQGAAVVLFDEGPFELPPTELTTRLLALRAAQGVRPRLRVSLPAKGVAESLKIQGGTLLLEGLDVIGVESTDRPADPWTWFGVTNGNARVERCSFNQMGSRAGPTLALKIDGTAQADGMSVESHILLDKSLLRGSGLQALQLDGRDWQTVVRHSLLASGDAPVVKISSADKAEGNVVRRLITFESTCASRQKLIDLDSAGNTNPVELQLIHLGSVLTAPPDSRDAVLCGISNWPRKGTAGTAFKNLTWNGGGALYLGWKTLLSVPTEQGQDITEADKWRTFWREPLEAAGITVAPWPKDLAGSWVKAPISVWQPATALPLVASLPVANGKPGCPIKNLPAPDLESADAVLASRGNHRPAEPPVFVSKKTVAIDLMKQDLGKILASQNWEDGTTFVATGHGTRQSSPWVIDGKRWQFIFQQDPGQPLIIAPKPGSLRGSPNSSFIQMRNGVLDVQHLTFQSSPQDASSVPQWFLHADGGRFSLNNCRIQLPPSGNQKVQGAIQWTGTPEPPTVGSEYAAVSTIQNSLVHSSGSVLSLDLTRRGCVIKNCVLAGRQNLIDVRWRSQAPVSPSALDVQFSTLVCGGTFVQARPERQANVTLPTARCWWSHCVFAPQLQDLAQRQSPVVLVTAPDVKLNDELVWQELKSGYNADVKTFFVTSSTGPLVSGPPQKIEDDWIARWGADKVRTPLYGPGAVLFENQLPGVQFYKPAQFALHRSSKARSGGDGGLSLGARLDLLEPPAPVAGTTPKGIKPRSPGIPGF